MKRIRFHQEQLFPSVLNHIHDGIIALDTELTIIYMNPAAERMSALNSRNVQGYNIHQVFSLIEPQNLSSLLPMIFTGPGENKRSMTAINTEKLISFRNAILKSYHGITLIVEGNINCFSSVMEGQPGYMLVFRDISNRKRLSILTDYRSHYDSLTGLSNHEGLTIQLKEMLGDLGNQEVKHTLLELEIDRFSKITHAAGAAGMEEILKQFAGILRSKIQQKDIAARISAGTFILALRDCSIRDAVHVAGRINVAVSSHVFMYRELEFPLSVSMGLVALPKGKTNIDTLLRSARAACNYAKQEEGSRIFCFT
ncbi:MAG: diguanylate cyclase [Treponema sp.]|jgi:diguanylate cyclase (GGDEF)-like protein/PAS domain S-box-containing protein|nr:diguanylate cyclase [Treponema sp.]